MVKPCSIDLRERVVSAHLSGESSRSVARRFEVAVSSVVKWSQLYRETGSVAPAKMGGRRPRLLEPHRDFVLEQVQRTPHLTLAQLQGLLACRGVSVSLDTIWRFLRREKLSFKKNPVRA